MSKTSRLISLLVVTGLSAPVLVAACTSQAAPIPFKVVADTKTLMNATLDPAADGIWDAVGTIITLQGTEEIQPRTEEDWMKVRNSAVTLAESGNLLMMVPRAKDGGDWMKGAQALIETSESAIRAADARDPDALFNAGADIYASCTNCHSKYALEIRAFERGN
jgi:hypothetical protein